MTSPLLRSKVVFLEVFLTLDRGEYPPEIQSIDQCGPRRSCTPGQKYREIELTRT